ncbi:MAG: N-acetylmuramic acid 6-phosphate etherase [Paracoccaceae bacterium]
MTERPTEARHPCSAGLHAAPASDVLAHVLDAQIVAMSVVRTAVAAIEVAAIAAVEALQSGHRMAYAGAGSSGLMALADGLELAGTFGIPPDRTPVLFAGGVSALLHMTGGAEDDPKLAEVDLAQLSLGVGDVVICVSASGSTPYTLAVARGAKACGAQVVGVACVGSSALLDMADIVVLLDTGSEVISGSTRMGAAAAQKVALNMLSVLVGIRLGHVHDGYMVNVVADNAKLMDRAMKIVTAVSGCRLQVAQEALIASSGAVKPAILIARGVALDRAEAILAANGGHLAPALAAILN